MKRNNPRSIDVLRKIVVMAHEAINDFKALRNPNLNIPIRSLSNINFDEERRMIEMGDKTQERIFFHQGMSKKFMQTFLVANACTELLKVEKTTSIRDLFYMTKHTLSRGENTFDDQAESDIIIEDLEVTLGALREELHLFASNRGTMVGNLTLVDSGDTINARRIGSGGWGIPSIVEEDVIKFKDCDANYILLIEKDAVWRRLNEDKFWRKHGCIMIQSQGQTSRGVRRLIRRMHDELNLPVYVLVDNDPWGLYIYSVIKQGSINLAYESVRMAIPDARFLGLSSFDREKFDLPDVVTISLDKNDEKRAKQMLAYPWFKDQKWQKELKKLLDSRVKLELEALSAKGISFISENYLPDKIEGADFLC
ncbi:DNA topoisomerase IV subunit A [Myxococcota bacterium]|nr:DNA topoisomerase IV subunit A [Myxococcota bacterium]MBU1380684.1 DNA topoisomerase IV subunit A [Myxococcota bacterium]MBU1495892.1 DNA topoisomerase IV subunit A [Myxococcota bacterium]